MLAYGQSPSASWKHFLRVRQEYFPASEFDLRRVRAKSDPNFTSTRRICLLSAEVKDKDDLKRDRAVLWQAQ